MSEMEEKKYAVTFEFKVGVSDDDLTFNVNTEYHQMTALYVKDAMSEFSCQEARLEKKKDFSLD